MTIADHGLNVYSSDMRHTCIDCGARVGSWVHTDYEDPEDTRGNTGGGHGINPVCDACYALRAAQG